MDKRRSERVQFFQIDVAHEIEPVWVFRHGTSDAVLGLVLDISCDGVQVLTDRDSPQVATACTLVIYPDSGDSLTLDVQHRWSRDEGTLYLRSGFEFTDDPRTSPQVDAVLAAQHLGRPWLRCELITLDA